MAHTQRAVDETAADTDDLDICAVVSAVVADLLIAAQGGKIADRIGKDRFPLKRKSGSHAGHILLGDSRVDKLLRHSLPIGL